MRTVNTPILVIGAAVLTLASAGAVLFSARPSLAQPPVTTRTSPDFPDYNTDAVRMIGAVTIANTPIVHAVDFSEDVGEKTVHDGDRALLRLDRRRPGPRLARQPMTHIAARGDMPMTSRELERLECCCQDSQESFVGQAFDRLGLDPAQRQLLTHSFREVSVQIPLNVGHGSETALRTFMGCRVQHNHARRGPFKGGLRYHPSVDLDEIRALAATDDLEDRVPGRQGG